MRSISGSTVSASVSRSRWALFGNARPIAVAICTAELASSAALAQASASRPLSRSAAHRLLPCIDAEGAGEDSLISRIEEPGHRLRMALPQHRFFARLLQLLARKEPRCVEQPVAWLGRVVGRQGQHQRTVDQQGQGVQHGPFVQKFFGRGLLGAT